jgi:magnesium chelatase family protein
MQEVQRYMAKISGPLLDRIDIHVHVPAVDIDDLAAAPTGESSNAIRVRVVRARERQHQRFAGRLHLFKNADMSAKEVTEYCALDQATSGILQQAMRTLRLSARAYDRIIKVARTIADISGSDAIIEEHVREAIQYRSLDRIGLSG